MDDRDELPLCRQPKKSSLQQFNEFWSQTFAGEFLMGNLTSLTTYFFGAAMFYFFPFLWVWMNKRRIIQEGAVYEKYTSNMHARVERIDIKVDDLLATSNSGHLQRSGSMNKNETISTQPRNSDRRGRSNIDNGFAEKDIKNKGEIKEIEGEVAEKDIKNKGEIEEIEVKVILNIPNSDESSKVVGIAQNSRILGTSSVSIKGSRILEKKVKVRDDILDELSRLAGDCTAIDNRVTIQLGDCRIFIRTDRRVEQLKLDTHRDKLPVILHSSYALGTLTIEGMYLEGATLKVATFKKSITLKNAEHKQVKNELGVWTWFGQLPSNNCDKVYVCATKKVHIQAHKVLVTSSVVKIQDNNLRSVVRFGIPSIILMIYIASQLYQDGQKLMKSSYLAPDLAWIVPPSFIILIHFLPILPPSTENKIRESFERVCLVFLVLCSSTWNFLFKQHPDIEDAYDSRRRTFEQELLDGGSKESDDDAIDNSVARNTSQYGDATVALVSLTRSIAQLSKRFFGLQKVLLEDFGVDGSSDDGSSADKPSNHDGSSADKPSNHDGPSDIDVGNDPDRKWQAYQEHKLRSGKIQLKKCGDKQKESISIKMQPFDVIYGLKEKLWSKRDYIRIFSPFLTRITMFLIPHLIAVDSEECIEVYASDLFHIRKKLRVIGSEGVNQVLSGNLQLPEEDREKLQSQVGHLLRFMDMELENVLKRYSVMKSGRHVSWDMLWAFFPVGKKVVYQCAVTDERLLGTVIRVAYNVDQRGEFLKVVIKMWDYNCNTWDAYKTSRSIYQFDGDCIFSNLQTYPLRFSNDPKKDEKEFLRRGEVFCELSMLVRNRFMNYNGLIYMQKSVNGCAMLVKEAASGRVMVDLGSFAKMNPNYTMQSAEPPCEVLRDNVVALKDITTSPERMYSPAMVYGFSFRLKKWGIFQVCGFSEIAFNESAFDALVMPERRKVLVERLVREYMPKRNTTTLKAGIDLVVRDEASSQQIDPIVSKGEGCSILCYGPPGTGKTLTAESIAEKLHAPLWSLSVSELGTTPDALESYLVKVLDVAVTWSAILLLDEADVYLEKRSSFDLTRTAMTGIFLRNLEYYRGVLFLTTNRIVTFDEAFRSRINMILYYEINLDDRRKIWSTILSRINMKNIADDKLDQFSEYDLNGRDIRNVVHRATILSKNSIGGRLTLNDIQQSLDELVESLDVYAEKRAIQSSEVRSPSK